MSYKSLISFCLLIYFSSISWSQSINTFLPEPTGIYNVGTTKLFLTDSSRKDPFKPSQYRKVYVKVWYPAMIHKDSVPEKYLQDYPLDVVYETFKMKKLDRKWIAELQENYTFSFPNANISYHQEKYPLLIFNPGFYFGLPDLYISIMEDLASHGYIVCSINHPYEQPYIQFDNKKLKLKKKRAQWAYLQLLVADLFQWKARDSEEHIDEITRYYHKMLHRFGKTVELWSEDSQFVLDELSKEHTDPYNELISRIDFNQIGAFGQSLGGAVSGHLCTLDNRVKAGANLDCFQFGNPINDPIKQAFMLIQSDYNESWNLGNTINYKHIDGDFAFLNFPGSSHFAFSDAAILPYESNEIRENMIGPINGAKVLNNVKLYLLDFFNFYLKDAGPEYIHSDRQLSHLKFNFRKGIQFKKSSSSASNN